MPTFPIHSGVFQLPDNLPRWLSTVTVSCGSASGGSVTVTDPDGTVIYEASFVGVATASLSLLNFPQLVPGAYTVAVVGSITGTLNVGDK